MTSKNATIVVWSGSRFVFHFPLLRNSWAIIYNIVTLTSENLGKCNAGLLLPHVVTELGSISLVRPVRAGAQLPARVSRSIVGKNGSLRWNRRGTPCKLLKSETFSKCAGWCPLWMRSYANSCQKPRIDWRRHAAQLAACVGSKTGCRLQVGHLLGSIAPRQGICWPCTKRVEYLRTRILHAPSHTLSLNNGQIFSLPRQIERKVADSTLFTYSAQ